jgi:hypothetical protein
VFVEGGLHAPALKDAAAVWEDLDACSYLFVCLMIGEKGARVERTYFCYF